MTNPWREKSWCVAELNEDYIACMEDVLYEKPLSEKEPVVCLDEKPVVLHADVCPPRPMRPGRIVRRDCEYERCGTANVFCGVQPKAGRHFTKPTANRSSPEFADYLVEIVASYPGAETIHLVMDNLSFSHAQGNGGTIWTKDRRSAVGPVPSALHTKARQLAQPGGDRDRLFLSPVPGPQTDPVPGRTAAGNTGVELENEPRSCHHQLAVHP